MCLERFSRLSYGAALERAQVLLPDCETFDRLSFPVSLSRASYRIWNFQPS